MSDLIDEKGHTREDAAAQVPNLDLDAPAASQEQPAAGGDVMVAAQTPEEVEAQVKNIPGGPDANHDLKDQLVEAAEYDAEDAEDAGDDEGAAIAEAAEEVQADLGGEIDDDAADADEADADEADEAEKEE